MSPIEQMYNWWLTKPVKDYYSENTLVECQMYEHSMDCTSATCTNVDITVWEEPSLEVYEFSYSFDLYFNRIECYYGNDKCEFTYELDYFQECSEEEFFQYSTLVDPPRLASYDEFILLIKIARSLKPEVK